MQPTLVRSLDYSWGFPSLLHERVHMNDAFKFSHLLLFSFTQDYAPLKLEESGTMQKWVPRGEPYIFFHHVYAPLTQEKNGGAHGKDVNDMYTSDSIFIWWHTKHIYYSDITSQRLALTLISQNDLYHYTASAGCNWQLYSGYRSKLKEVCYLPSAKPLVSPMTAATRPSTSPMILSTRPPTGAGTWALADTARATKTAMNVKRRMVNIGFVKFSNWVPLQNCRPSIYAFSLILALPVLFIVFASIPQ